MKSILESTDMREYLFFSCVIALSMAVTSALLPPIITGNTFSLRRKTRISFNPAIVSLKVVPCFMLPRSMIFDFPGILASL